MKFQLVTTYRVSHFYCYGVTICGNVTSVDPPLEKHIKLIIWDVIRYEI